MSSMKNMVFYLVINIRLDDNLTIRENRSAWLPNSNILRGSQASD